MAQSISSPAAEDHRMGHTDRRTRRRRQLLIATGAVAAALCLTIFVLQRPNVPDPDVYEPAGTYKPTPADASVREKLKASIASLDLSGVELRQAIGELREISGVGIRVNWAALAKERVMPETLVNVRLKNVTLDKAIRTVLDDVSCIGPGHRNETGLGHVVEDGAITISSKSDLEGHLDTREYDISDITSLVAKFRHKEDMPVNEDGVPLFEVSRDEIVGEINCLVFEAINESESDVREKGEKLVVTLDTASHESIAKVLEKLRTRLNSRRSDPRPEKPAAADVAVGELLDRKIGEFDFYDTELQKAIDFIRDKSGINIHVKWHAIARESIGPDTKVSVHSTNKTRDDGVRLENATFAEALQAVCRGDASEGEPGIGPVGLDYVVRDGVVTVSTKSDLRESTSFRIYDIGDMISSVADAESLPQSYREIVDQLRTVVVETIDSTYGCGPQGGDRMIREIGGLFVVVQTIEHHESLARLLRELHASFRGRGPVIRSSVRSPRDRFVRKQLDLKLSKFCSPDHEIQHAIQFFRDVSGVDIRVDWRALETAGLKPDTEFFVDLITDMPIGKALDVLLDSFPSKKHRIGYVIRDGAVMVSTEDELISPKAFRVYDVRDLIAPVCAREGPPVSRAEAVGRIRTLISDAIDRDSWDYIGEIGVICSIGGRLVITQTIDNHEAIDELLGDLRRHFKTPNLDPHSHHETQAERAIRKQLELKIPKLDLDDDEFGEAVSAVLGIYEPNMYANWRWPTGDEVKPPGKVSLHLKNVTRREALDAVFDIANKGSGLRMDYTIIGDRIMIAPQAKLLRSSTIRIYDARDIIARKMKATTAPARSRDKTVEEITGLIREAIAPGSWRDDGGSLGTIDEISGLLVITQICRHHESLAALMKKLRADTK